MLTDQEGGAEASDQDDITQAIRQGQRPDVSSQHSEPMVLTSSYFFDDAADAAEKFAGRRPGNVYVRFDNPTVQLFEQRLAALEGAEMAVACASGMSAYLLLAMTVLKAGDHVVLALGMFGTTAYMFREYFSRFGISTTLVDPTNSDAWEQAVTADTRLFVVESPTNPMMHVADLAALSSLAARHSILLAVDNTLCTPIFQKPIQLGADIVLHSAGKYIDGQGRCGGGVIAGKVELMQKVRRSLRTFGPSLSPFNAWIFVKSLETLDFRMRAHHGNAVALAAWLRNQPLVRKVYFTGAPDHPQAELIARQQRGHGGLISFVIDGGRDAAWGIIDRLRLISLTTNIGDTKTMITHPASTTHALTPVGEREAAGVTDNLLRISVGLEAIGGLTADLAQAFAKTPSRG